MTFDVLRVVLPQKLTLLVVFAAKNLQGCCQQNATSVESLGESVMWRLFALIVNGELVIYLKAAITAAWYGSTVDRRGIIMLQA